MIRPPLKLDNSIQGFDASADINDFLQRRVQNFRKLLDHDDFVDHFKLKLNIVVSDFDLERDQLNTNMFLPTC